MKISGFTIIRNAVINDYPVVEAIRSILPVVDEMVVSVGDSEDDTEGLIRAIGSPKIRIVHSVWDPALKTNGTVLAVETDKAFRQISPDADWAFYIQADEVVHEQYHAAIRQATEQHVSDKRVEGLLFNYTHFYGTYDYIGDSRRWYSREVRIIRNDADIHSYKDAQGFRRSNGEKLRVKPANAAVYHYGWVKNPEQMIAKMRHLDQFWNGDQRPEDHPLAARAAFSFDDYDSLERFTGTHPAVMQDRVARQNWQVDIDVRKKRFDKPKYRFLYWVEKLTGRRFFEFRNFRLV
ncbi:glycosyltransferase family 2 protein [Hymenobacter sediminicola]|uniref:Glycosyltransferase family 2 protein n=1 Tax=Hymenobacter sediminicola TaxID=2761579 RepID=A0A7G7W4V1_9BACT|nr:glycosyltransferase family 2 protein [Hymenobacter sediminicola]QNH61394.1 glycosyltransferase family 2 protein [Hymenobacter sediminicola]